MDDVPLSTDATAADTPTAPSETTAATRQQSVIDQAKDAGRKLLATITGHKR